MTPTTIATAAAAAAGLLALAPAPVWSAAARRRTGVAASRAPGWAWLVPLLMLAVVAGAGPVAVGALVAAGTLVAAERSRIHRRRARARTAEAVAEAASVLAAELTAGRTPAQALSGAAEAAPELVGSAARVSAVGGDPRAALLAASAIDGAWGLAGLAAGWHVAQSTGAPLAAVLARIREVVESELALSREVDEQLAPVHATARVMAALPLLGVLMALGLGVNVPHLLLTTLWGQVCLLAAVSLVAAALALIDRIAQWALRR
jgi:tight adherence protein B